MTTPDRDSDLAEQIDAIAQLPLEQRAQALDEAAKALRDLLDATD